jgi:hypothetical protein
LRGFGARVVFLRGEQVFFPLCPRIAAADGDEAVGGFLPGLRGWAVRRARARGGVAEALQMGAVGGVLVPDAELEENEAQAEQDLGTPVVGDV